ncbi:MAG: RsmB/NOP family class I SAM-dependent RNA methyltransferase [Burkholderiales bacterium]|nr:RsmB/NOP family class I SAM-dependent RNA methyltransferase [Burkholderiales bacterium]
MPIHSSQFEAAAEALRRVLTFDHPADAILGRYFREHRGLGQIDRTFVAESVFGVLRRKRLLDRLTGGDAAPRRLLLAYLMRIAGISGRELHAVLANGEAEWLAGLRAISLDDLPLAVRADLPDWLVERLRLQMPGTDILALGRALQQPAPLDLRVNTLRADRDTVLRQLAATGIEGEATPYSPLGIRLKGKPALNRHPLFLDGSVEVQDEGSQLLGYLVAPKRHELVVDFCAGAGGKTLMLGAMMQSHGRIYAFDVSEKRLARLKPRLKRSGLSNLHPQRIQNENDTRVKRLAGKIDRVLVDAPCSGLGTLRRNPDLKWRQSPQAVEALKLKQAAILSSAARLLKPGGRLVYATCSLLAEENQDIVGAFLAQHQNFKLLNCNDILKQQQINLDTGPYLQLWPHRHATDGFFAAVMCREN